MSRFLVTGGVGFIGSHLVTTLVDRGDDVRVIDDISTGARSNIESVLDKIEFVEDSICNREVLDSAMQGVEFCLHHAAIPSVPRSVERPLESNRANVDGTLNVLDAAAKANVNRVVVISSSSVYGDKASLPAREDESLNPISPYAVTKAAGELYAGIWPELYGLEVVILRYFNVFGPRQDPNSAYAGVIPLFIQSMLQDEKPRIFGDGMHSRDCSYVSNVVDANLAVCEASSPVSGVFNVACGQSTTLLGLVDMLNRVLEKDIAPIFELARPGDIRASLADIQKARDTFGYEPKVDVEEGLRRTVAWHAEGLGFSPRET